jgi:hypothetical protein
MTSLTVWRVVDGFAVGIVTLSCVYAIRALRLDSDLQLYRVRGQPWLPILLRWRRGRYLSSAQHLIPTVWRYALFALALNLIGGVFHVAAINHGGLLWAGWFIPR